MNVERVLAELKAKYPGKNIICLPEDKPTEIICEIKPTSEDSEESKAVCVIDQSEPHIHPLSSEFYEVLKGPIFLHVEGETRHLKEGETFTIKPGKVHFATGDEAWVRVTSTPGWTPEDHILVD